jgi:hypothetical protein
MILHSSICLSHNRPNQFSEQIHANLRAERGTVTGDSTQSPCPPHGLTGVHNEASGVQFDCVVVVGQDVVVVVGQGSVGVDQDDVVVDQDDVGVDQEDVGVGQEGVVSGGLTM